MKQALVALCLLPAGLLIVGNTDRNPSSTRESKAAAATCDCASPVLNPEIAVPYSANASKIPDIKAPELWRDSNRPLPAREVDLIGRMSLAEKVAQLQNDAPAIPRLGLPAFNYWNEALHGVANNGVATVFPEPIGGAASWNPSLFRQEGEVIGIEGRAKFNDYANQHGGDSKWWYGLTYWTPNINIFRDPRWGRGQETYGEDPFLTGEIGVEFVKGIQGDNPKYMLAMACAKHYAVHSGPESERHRFDASPPESDFYDTYLPQFERVVRDGHVAGVMGSYNSVYGLPACASPLLLHDLLRTKWGFNGYVVSDCGAIGDIWRQHRFVGTAEEAAAAALKAGCDLCCGGDYNALVRAVQKGLVTEADVDKALTHTLWTRFRLGLFDSPNQVPFSKYTLRDNDTAEHDAVALRLARQSVVLLKNNGILPLDSSKLKRIAVIGPNADSRSMLEGNYHGSGSHSTSILSAIKQIAGPNVQVDYAMGSPVTSSRATAPYSRQDNETNRSLGELSAEAVGLAQHADLVIYVGGITAAQEGESFDRKRIELPGEQESLIEALQATGKPIVMVNCSGSAMALGWEDEHLPAILQAWYPGQEGGRAVAEILFGAVNPSGHLPVTFYRSTADLPSFTDYSMAHRTYRFFDGKPLYAFGHGLSYTRFEFSGRRSRGERVGSQGKVRLKFEIKNSGPYDGDEVAQIYYRRKSSGSTGPKLSLCGFQRVSLKRGATARVSIEIPMQRLRHWDAVKKRYVVEPGAYELLVGDASDEIKLTEPLTVTS
jgi:beta-glucosidase